MVANLFLGVTLTQGKGRGNSLRHYWLASADVELLGKLLSGPQNSQCIVSNIETQSHKWKMVGGMETPPQSWLFTPYLAPGGWGRRRNAEVQLSSGRKSFAGEPCSWLWSYPLPELCGRKGAVLAETPECLESMSGFSRPLSTGDAFQDSQWMPETVTWLSSLRRH
jgi:hypothetical protein